MTTAPTAADPVPPATGLMVVPPTRIAALTGIRGIAALWVVAFHASSSVGRLFGDEALHRAPVLRAGYLAVDLFFVLSGFILSLTYLDGFASSPRTTAWRFTIGRLLRILPLNWFTLAVLVAMSRLIPDPLWATPGFSLRALWPAAFLTQSWGGSAPEAWNYPAWSLSTEWAAYVAFPALAIALARVGRPRTVLFAATGALAALAALMLVAGHGTLDHAGALGTPRCLLEFAAGACLFPAVAAFRSGGGPLFVAGTIVLAAALLVPRVEVTVPVAFALIVAACFRRARATEWLFGNRVVTFLGEVSFSIYLIHAVVLIAFDLAVGGRHASGAAAEIGVLLALLAGIVAAATVTWRLVELPGQALGRRLRRRAGDPARPTQAIAP